MPRNQAIPAWIFQRIQAIDAYEYPAVASRRLTTRSDGEKD